MKVHNNSALKTPQQTNPTFFEIHPSALMPQPVSQLETMTRTTKENADGSSDELVERARAGDAEALDRWLRRDHTAVFRLCLGFLGDYGEAEDLAQDAMLKLVDRLDQWTPPKKFRSWRNTVVANLCRDHLRKQRLRPAPTWDMEIVDSGSLQPSPGGKLQGSELQTMILQALTTLSPREREVFVLRDLESVPTSEVSSTLSITQSSVRSLLTTARRRIRNILAPKMDMDGGCKS